MASSKIVFFLLGILVHSGLAADGASWSYKGADGPSYWYKTYPICKNTRQSPINIFEGDVKANGVSEAFSFKNYDVTEGLTMTLSNTGYAAKVTFSGSALPEVSGGGLGDTYVAAQYHFHWNKDQALGSEHHISSMGFPSELHIVHYKKSYGDLGTAADKSDGLAVLGFMLEVSKSDNSNYKDLVSSLSKVADKDAADVVLAPATLNSFLPDNFQKFYRYDGSLTTPPCYESVTWTVFKETIKISEEQLEGFLELKNELKTYIWDNVRPVEPLNDREVMSNYDSKIKWGYVGGYCDTDKWDMYYSACNGDSQSPVNIPSTASTKDLTLGNFTFNGFDKNLTPDFSVFNNGHTIQVDVGGVAPPTMSGGGLPEEFTVAQFHFHWGSTSMKGSEHTRDGVMYPMEVHVVTYKSSLGSLGNAATKAEGLAVLGFFFEVSNTDNTNYGPLMTVLENLKEPESSSFFKNTTTLSLDDFIPADRTKFFRYPGSLTTPGCYESVIWSVFDSTIPISEAQLNKFRALKSSDKNDKGDKVQLVNNYRPVLNLNSRIVKANFEVVAPPSKTWTYQAATGPQNWYKDYPVCGSTLRQSPIDIVPRNVESMKFSPFQFTNFDNVSGVSLKLKNNGHSVVVSYESGHLQVTGGGLPGTFRVKQFHFHWGSTDKKGSEHTIDGDSFPLELHIVTYNEIYNDIGLALTQGNGLAVLGFMYKVSENDNPNLAPMLNSFNAVQNPKSETSLSSFTLESMMADTKNFYRYDGSLTTPSCAESVTWTVFQDTIPISKSQLATFRQLISSELDADGKQLPMVNNYRPTLALGDRTVYANFKLSGAPSSTHAASATLAIFIIWIGRLFASFSA